MLKFNYNFSFLTKFILSAITLFILVNCAFAVLRLSHLFNQHTTSVFLDVLLIVLTLICVVFIIFIFRMKYKIDDKQLYLQLLRYKLMAVDIINISDIIKCNSENKLYINCLCNDELKVIHINIAPEKYDLFVDELRVLNSKIFYQVDERE